VESRLTARANIRLVALGDEAVVFHPSSWSSHVLNAAAAAVLEFILERPRTRQEIAALLQELLNAAEQPSLQKHVESVIGDLCIIDLIHEV